MSDKNRLNNEGAIDLTAGFHRKIHLTRGVPGFDRL